MLTKFLQSWCAFLSLQGQRLLWYLHFGTGSSLLCLWSSCPGIPFKLSHFDHSGVGTARSRESHWHGAGTVVAQVLWRAIGSNSICFWWPVQLWILFSKRSWAEINRQGSWRIRSQKYRFRQVQNKAVKQVPPVEMFEFGPSTEQSGQLRCSGTALVRFDALSHTEWPSCSKDCYWCWVSQAGDAAWQPGFSIIPASSTCDPLWTWWNIACLRHGATNLKRRLVSCSDWATAPVGSAK